MIPAAPVGRTQGEENDYPAGCLLWEYKMHTCFKPKLVCFEKL